MFRRNNIPLVESTGVRGVKRWRIEHGGELPPLTFTFDEAAALSLARRYLEPLAGTDVWEAAQSALEKVRSTLDETALDYFERLLAVFHCTDADAGMYRQKAGIIDDLDMAIEDRRVAQITYQSLRAATPTARDLHPLSLVPYRGALYLIAFSPNDDQVRTYKVDRIEAVTVSARLFQRPRSFNVREYLAGSFGIYVGTAEVTVVVKFLPEVARYIHEREKPWHPSQVAEPQHDGSTIVTYRLSSTVEIKSWVLGFGCHAIVLEPEALRAEIARDLDHLLKHHYQITPDP
jgi:predicted DNA-binding transcriptional regulator YafY